MLIDDRYRRTLLRAESHVKFCEEICRCLADCGTNGVYNRRYAEGLCLVVGIRFP